MSELKSRATTGRVLAALLAGSLVLTFWGCGGSNSVNLTPPGGGDAGEDATGPGEDGSTGGRDGSGGQDATGGHDATGGQDATGGGDSGSTGNDGGGGDTGTGDHDSGSGGVDSGSGGTDGGHDACVPKTCAQQGFDCGTAGDGCGNVIDCGTCPTGQTCGGGRRPERLRRRRRACRRPARSRASTAAWRPTAAAASSSAARCPASQICGGGGANVCGSARRVHRPLPPADHLPGHGARRASAARSTRPNGTDPLYNALVYVPNGGPRHYGVQPFTPGVACGAAAPSVTGSPLVSAVTAVDGTFTLTNMPVGHEHPARHPDRPLAPAVHHPQRRRLHEHGAADARRMHAACRDAAAHGRRATSRSWPSSTGSVDALECVLRKIGIADSEFTDPRRRRPRPASTWATGSIAGRGARHRREHADRGPALGDARPTINEYDMVLLPVPGRGVRPQPAAAQQTSSTTRTRAAASSPRTTATCGSTTTRPSPAPPTWDVGPDATPFADDPETGFINTDASPRAWRSRSGSRSSTRRPRSARSRSTRSATTSTASSRPRCSGSPIDRRQLLDGTVPMHYTFDTPVGARRANQCGRVLFGDFHVEDASEPAPRRGTIFPAECTGNPMTPQEKMLEFMHLRPRRLRHAAAGVHAEDLRRSRASAAAPPATAAATSSSAAPARRARRCGGGACGTAAACTPKTCAEQGFACGSRATAAATSSTAAPARRRRPAAAAGSRTSAAVSSRLPVRAHQVRHPVRLTDLAARAEFADPALEIEHRRPTTSRCEKVSSAARASGVNCVASSSIDDATESQPSSSGAMRFDRTVPTGVRVKSGMPGHERTLAVGMVVLPAPCILRATAHAVGRGAMNRALLAACLVIGAVAMPAASFAQDPPPPTPASAMVPTPVQLSLVPPGEPTSFGTGLPPSLAVLPLRLSLMGDTFPIASALPGDPCLAQQEANSAWGFPIHRATYLRLLPQLTLHGFSTGGCTLDASVGGSVSYAITLPSNMWLVVNAGAALPAQHARGLADARRPARRPVDAAHARSRVRGWSGTTRRDVHGAVVGPCPCRARPPALSGLA